MASPFAASAYSDQAADALQHASLLQQIKDKGDPQAVATHNASVGAPAAPQPGQFGWGGYFQSIGVIFLLLAALGLALYLLKRFGPRSGLGLFKRGDLRLESQLPLGPKKSVVVVRFLNKRLVLGVAESQINLLTEVDIDHDPDNPDFSQTMEQAQHSLDPPRT